MVELILFSLPSSGQRGDAVWSSDDAEDGDSRGEADCSLQTVWGDPLSSPQVELEKRPHARCIWKYSSCKTFRLVTGILAFRFSSKFALLYATRAILPGQKQLLDGLALDPAVFTGQSSPLPGPVLLFLLFLPSLPPSSPSQLMNALTVQTHFHWALKSLLRDAKTFRVPLQRSGPEAENKHVTVSGKERHGSNTGWVAAHVTS